MRAVHGVVAFVVGDDVWIAVSVALLVGLAAALVGFGLDPWWLLPAGVPAALAVSLARASGTAARDRS